MWAIKHPDGTTETRGALPTRDLVPVLGQEFPASIIYRSKKPCHNEFGELAFAKHWVQRGEREIALEDGTTVTEPILVCERVGNTYAMEGDSLVVYSPDGEKLGAFEMEVARDPRA
jgi:hypothetical protein